MKRDRPEGPGPDGDEEAWLGRALELVRARTGLDFRGYRSSTLLRRVRNGMISSGVRTLPEYVARLEADPGETDALAGRLTIKVSRFFRDAPTFAALREALARRREAHPERALAVWSAGCGQGEEAYSLALLLAEQGQTPGGADVLATDLDAQALAQAERGCYPGSVMEGLSAELRARWFDERPAGRSSMFCARPELRRRLEVRVHDLTAASSSPDGRRFDLVCCRNVLIYLEPRLQAHVEALLARSLLPGGLLCLGEAEWLLPAVAGSFTVIDRRARLFALRAGDRLEGSP